MDIRSELIDRFEVTILQRRDSYLVNEDDKLIAEITIYYIMNNEEHYVKIEKVSSKFQKDLDIKSADRIRTEIINKIIPDGYVLDTFNADFG